MFSPLVTTFADALSTAVKQGHLNRSYGVYPVETSADKFEALISEDSAISDGVIEAFYSIFAFAVAGIAMQCLKTRGKKLVEKENGTFDPKLRTTRSPVDASSWLMQATAKSKKVNNYVIGCNTVMKGYLQAGKLDAVFELYEKMLRQGVPCSEVTFAIILEASVVSNDLDHSKQIINDLKRFGFRMNVVHYTTYMKGLTAMGKLSEASALLEEMLQTEDARPDLITYTTLIKACADAGDITGALRVLDIMINEGIPSDQIILNIILSGCCSKAMEAAEILSVFDHVQRLGLEPSNATLSILIKAFAAGGHWSKALETIVGAPRTMRLHPESRIFAQLCQACVRVGEKNFAIQVYAAMIRLASETNSTVDETANSRMYRLCGAKTARLYSGVVAAGGRLEATQMEVLLREVMPSWR